jgi:hypothetical protein
MIAPQSGRSVSFTARTFVALTLIAAYAAEYVGQTITYAPGYTLLAGVSHVPAPIVVSPNAQNWDGIDGAWNTFTLRIGSQRQNTSVLVSTANQQVWVVNAQACTTIAMGNLPGTASRMPSQQCVSSRGYLFNTSTSETWMETGYYSLEAGQNIGLDAVGYYGLDTVRLGTIEEEGPAIDNTTIGTIGTYSTLATPEHWLGHIGLQSVPNTFLDQPSRPSFITSLFETQSIPSESFGYTAGAQYRKGNATFLGSLTLGGYDASRFVPNNVIFRSDSERKLVVGLAGLTAQTAEDSDIDLLNGTDVNLSIDSTIAELWLPVHVCKLFEDAFGLTYDEDTGLYLVDNILHQILQERNPSFTFTLREANGTLASGAIQVTLPYAAFDLQAQSPYQSLNQTTKYFPIRRGANESQWILGRTFLQEAYLTVDWERSQFSVNPCDWTGKQSDIVAIVSPRYGKAVSEGSEPSSKLSTAVIVGIVFGIIAAVTLVSASVWWAWRRRRQNVKANSGSITVTAIAESDNGVEQSTMHYTPQGDTVSNVFPKAELPGESNAGKDGNPFADSNEVTQPIYELMGNLPVNEAGGRQLSEKESILVRERNINGVDPSGISSSFLPRPVHRPNRISSMDKIAITDQELNENTVFLSTDITHEDGSTNLPPYHAREEDSRAVDLARRRFSYES